MLNVVSQTSPNRFDPYFPEASEPECKRSELAAIDTRDGIVSTIRRRGHDGVELVGFFDWNGSTDRRVPGQQLFDLL